MNEPIEIVVRKSEASQTAPSIATEQGKQTPQQQVINSALIATGKQAINQGIKLQGDLTGSYALSESVNTSTSFSADVLMIAKGGAVGLIAVGAKYAYGVADSYVKQRIADRENAFIRQRTGLISTRGSRYTDD